MEIGFTVAIIAVIALVAKLFDIEDKKNK